MSIFKHHAGGKSYSSTILHTGDGGKVHITTTVIDENRSGLLSRERRSSGHHQLVWVKEGDKRQKAWNRMRIN